jgi:hypothetical protein
MDLTFINNKFLYKQVNPLLHVGFPAFFNKKQNHLDGSTSSFWTQKD